jgi:hypothetical protein
MRPLATVAFSAAIALAGPALAQTSSGSGSVGGSGGSSGAVGSPGSSGMTSGSSGGGGVGSPGSAPSILTTPATPPGTEGSSGSPAAGGMATTRSSRTTSQGAGLSAEVQKTPRERELDRQARQIDQRVRRGICQGC